jgi:hypothetical protein
MYICNVIQSDFVERTSQSLNAWREKNNNRSPHKDVKLIL